MERAVCVLRRGTEILLVRDGERWELPSVAGTSEAAARRTVEPTAATLLRRGGPVSVDGDEYHPYLFECDGDPVSDGDDRKWCQPPAVREHWSGPGLWDCYLAVGPSVRTVREDTDHGAGYISLRALEVLRDRAADDSSAAELESLARRLRAARPAMGVLRTRVDRVMTATGSDPDAIYEHARTACTEAVQADADAAERAAATVGERILTLSRSGTVAAALEATTPEAVFVAASHPGGEGIDAAEAYADAGFETTLLADTAVADLLVEESAVDTMLIGADSVLADGAVVNKVGTRQAALAAADAGVDCFVVCSRDKIVPGTEFDPEATPEAVYDGDADLSVRAPIFERTPPHLLSGVITETGVLSAAEVRSIAETHAKLATWDASTTPP